MKTRKRLVSAVYKGVKDKRLASGFISHNHLFDMVRESICTWPVTRLRAHVISSHEDMIIHASSSEHKFAIIRPLDQSFVAGMLRRADAEALVLQHSSSDNILTIVELVQM